MTQLQLHNYTGHISISWIPLFNENYPILKLQTFLFNFHQFSKVILPLVHTSISLIF